MAAARAALAAKDSVGLEGDDEEEDEAEASEDGALTPAAAICAFSDAAARPMRSLDLPSGTTAAAPPIIGSQQ